MYLFKQGFHRIAHIEAEAKLLSFADDIIKCIFLNENVLMSLKISLKFVSQVPIDIGSDNALAPTRRQAIIWINDD